MNDIIKSFIIIVIFFSNINLSEACTNYIVTKGASTDSSVMFSYAADSHVLYGELYHWQAGTWPKDAELEIYEWDTGKYLGKIKQAPVTYNVIGNMNEHQVGIGETTYGGRHELHHQDSAILDYGSLIYIALQRSKSAREAIKVMTELVAEYGYYSEGESFTITDKNEAWIMEMIGKGQHELGAVWVALRIPDGYVSGHANQARITTFPKADDKKSITFKDIDKIYNKNIECVYSDDVITFARKNGWFDGKDKDFSFSDTYAPVDFGGARFCEIRVWTMFNKVSDNMDRFWDYAKGDVKYGKNGYAINRMPLWIKPNHKISLQEMMDFMRDHLEDTELDMSKDIGAGPFHTPYRWRPLTWKVDSVTYCNERATATQQTGFSFIAQSRSHLPDVIGGIIWWGVDDASGTVYMPMYSSITRTPENFRVGNGSIMQWSETSGFWLFNQVQNFAYSRYDVIHPEIDSLQHKLENDFITFTPAVDKGAEELFTQDRNKTIEYLTNYSCSVGSFTFKTWKDFYHYLFIKYNDGNIKTPREIPKGYKYVTPNLKQPGYSKEWYRFIIEKTGDQFKVK
jgi:dipeptidase